MVQVHILSDDFASPNGLAFLYPIVVHRQLLRDSGLSVRLFSTADAGLTDCDVLIIDSKAFRDRWSDGTAALEQIANWADKTATLFFDTTDSTGWVNAAVLPLVRGYYKNQILRDRSLYTQPLYGGRLHTDFVHRSQGISDELPAPPWPAVAPADVAKIRVGWNSGLADYSFAGLYRARLFRRLRWPLLLGAPFHYSPPSPSRPLAVSCRISTAYPRATVAWQRQTAKRLLAKWLQTGRLSRRRYFEEMRRSRVVISPFGFGEINYRDYETFLSGGLLLKPHMDHMETWPDFFREGETIVCHSWDLSDLISRLEEILAHYDRYVDIARQAQNTYRRYVSIRDGHEDFARRLRGIVDDTLR